MGGAFGLGLTLMAKANDPGDPNSMAILADTHVGEDRKQVMRGVCMAEHLQKVVAEVLAWETRPAGFIINGDCARIKGLPGDYAVLAEGLQPLIDAGIPLHLTMGNHDDRAPFYAAFNALRPAAPPLPDKIVSVLETPHANWFFLDSLWQVNVTTGQLGDAQLKWLTEALDARPGRPALILCHHNLQPKAGNHKGLSDSPSLLEILRPRKQVKAYLFGHQHRWQTHKDESGIHLINLPAVAYVFDKKQPSGWLRATTAPEGLRLELRSLYPAHPKHAQAVELPYRA